MPVDYLASALDPRTKALSFLPQSHAEATWTELERLVALSSEPTPLPPSQPEDDSDSDDDSIDLAGFFSRANDSGSVNSVNSPPTNVQLYRNVPQLSSSSSPLHWWNKNRHLFPQLAPLAMVRVPLWFFLCVLTQLRNICHSPPAPRQSRDCSREPREQSRTDVPSSHLIKQLLKLWESRIGGSFSI